MITQALCYTYKKDTLEGLHDFDDDFRFALYNSSATLNAETSAYTTTNEITAQGYTSGGAPLSGFQVVLDDNIACLTFDDVYWPNASISARGGLIYNNSLPGKNALCVIDFGTDIISTSGVFTVIMPPATKEDAVIRYV